MKKLFLIFFTFLMLVSSSFAFNLTNSNDNSQVYFPLSDSLVKVQTLENISSFDVKYVNGNITKITSYNLSSCNNSSKCGSFTITDFISNNGLTLANTNLSVVLNNVSKSVYLDITKPDFTFISSSIDNVSMKVNFVFSYSDNMGVSKVELYKKQGLDTTFVSNLTGVNNYSLDIVSAGVLELVFKVYDLAGNVETFNQNIEIVDFTKPKITSSKLNLKEGKYQLYFTLSDENLSKYEIVQGSLKLSGDVSGTSHTATINLPFDSGSIEFRVYDGAGNMGVKTILLSSPFTNTYSTKFSNDKIMKFTSNAVSCKLVSVDSSSDSRDFTKDGNVFSIDLNFISSIKNYVVNFYCENSDFKEEFTYDFFYDTNNPTNSTLSVSREDDGGLRLMWTDATDLESDVSYVLYRDGEQRYSGTKTKFVDSEVKYPNEYKYSLKVLDAAGNYVNSNDVSEVPKKVDITFFSNLLKEQVVQKNLFNLDFDTDTNTNVSIIVKNNLNVIFEKKFNTGSKTKFTEVLNLSGGVNEVIVKVVDEFLNVEEQSYFVTYDNSFLAEKPIVEQLKEKPAVVSPVFEPEPQVFEEFADSGVEEVSSPYFWAWFALWVLVLGVFIYFIFFRREIILKFIKKSSNNIRRHDGLGFAEGRRKDMVLGRNLDKIKSERVNRQREREYERRKIEAQKERAVHRSEFERKKHEDLAKPRVTPVSFSSRKKAYSNFKRMIKDKHLMGELKSSRSKKKSFFENLKEKFGPKYEGINKEDEISSYLSRKVSGRKNKSWENSGDYVQKESVVKSSVLDVKDKGEVKSEVKTEEVVKKPEKFERVSLDDYLSKRTKKKRFFFAEKQVENDIFRREK